MEDFDLEGDVWMNKMWIVVLGTVLFMNLLGYLGMWSDKKRAIKGKYRISEKKLFLIAILGGSMGSILGMNHFRHKTKHWYFKYGLPLILMIQIIVVGAIIYYGYIRI